MILDELTLHNFGVYRGRQRVALAPRSPNKPVVLFGALNGSGKTTLLDALQLVLYGKRAECSNRRELGYEEYLRRSIHRDVNPQEGAAIELSFRHYVDGEERRYRLHRSWHGSDRAIRERLEVWCNDSKDEVLTDSWPEHVEDFIPVKLSKFFFFDGEKIEALADLDRSSEVLATAVNSLLGLDIVDQLQTDLKVVIRRNRERQTSEGEREDIAEARAAVDRAEAEHHTALAARASQMNVVDRQRRRFGELEERFRKAGGDSFVKRSQIEAQRRQVATRLASVGEQLQQHAGGAAPLLLVRPMLEQLAAGASEERTSTTTLSLLESRDREVIKAAELAGASRELLTTISGFLSADRARRRTSASATFSVNEDAQDQLTRLLTGGELAEARAQSVRLLAEYESLAGELDVLDRQLAATPDDEAIASIVKELEAARQEVMRAEALLLLLEERLATADQERSQRWDAYTKLLDRDVDDEFRDKEAERIITHADAVRGALSIFRTRMAERHVRRIEQLVLESLHHLLRKQSLIASLTIDPSDYRMKLWAADGAPLSPERLSAGERQLLAISTIWGLARASGRPIPVVIDTPLGRLDSVHRRHLIERYFPFASHQVVLLSTDKEIDEAELGKLRPAIDRSYRMMFNERDRSSSIEEGYFW